MRTRTILLASLMILMSAAPLISAEISDYSDKKIDPVEYTTELIETVGANQKISLEPEIKISKLDENPVRISTSGTSGRAPCPAIQNDGGSAGDSGNTTGTAKPLGNDPNSSIQGCVDQTDNADWYSVQISQNKNIDVVLTFTATDFDLGIHNGTTWIDRDWGTSGTTEKVSTLGTFADGTGGTFYIAVDAYSGDGQYTLETWTNNSMPKPDMTITMVEGPLKAQGGDSVVVNYTVENLANNSSATTGAFDVFFILSTDTTYDSFDTILDDVSVEPDLAAGASRNTSMSVTIPVNISNDSYYWIVWADGYGNISEDDELNNNMPSPDVMVVGNDCTDLAGGTQNDAGLGSDAGNDPANATNMGSNITGTFDGCMDGSDSDDVYAFDVPSGYFIEVSLDAEDQSSDLDVFIHYQNNSEVDRGYTASYPETATAKLTDYEGLGGTYYVNVSHYSGTSNYTLDVWTNQSIPAPDYTIDTVTSPGSSQPGDTLDVTAVLENGGTIDGTSSVELIVILSVDSGVDWYDHEIGSITTSGIPVDTNTSVTISSTIPSDIVEGEYNMYVVVDQDDLILERNEDNNQQSRDGQFAVGNAETSCLSQNDAGMGGDAGNSTSLAFDLGNYADTEYRGCIDSSDTSDFYTVTMATGQNLNLTLVDPPSGAVNLAIVDSNGNGVDSDTSWFSDAEATTVGTSSDGVAGTYTIMVNRSTSWLENGGAGTYRLLLGNPSGYEAPFSCAGYSDVGTGTDAGTDQSNPMILGGNPTQSGQGCLDGSDISDSFQFSLEDYTNVHVMFTPDVGTPFTADMFDEAGNAITGWNGSEWSSMGDMAHEGMDGTFTVVIYSQGGEGYYNLSINSMPPAEADLAVTNLTCGAEMISNEELFYSFEIHNLRGPALGDFEWTLDLVDENGLVMEQLDSATMSTYANYGQVVLERASSTFINATTPTGTYSCLVMVNMEQSVNEFELINNDMMGDGFTIQNEEELWANDVDRDGYNTTDNGDGIVDDCPEKYGESFGDRYGCADLDGDGWSNLNDFSPLDPSQWIDEDEDGFGDNISGYQGDQCPGVPGIENGEGGDGCPPPFVDSDQDGVQDSDDNCDTSPLGVVVDENGCEIDSDSDGVADSMDDCPTTVSNATVDATGCEIIDENGDGDGDSGDSSGSGSEEEGESTSDSTESGTDVLTLGGIGFGVVLIIVLTFLIVRKGRSGDDLAGDSYANAAFDQPMGGMATADPSLTPEQLQYEQQLLAHGYTAEQARAYADQHFRPWLNQ